MKVYLYYSNFYTVCRMSRSDFSMLERPLSLASSLAAWETSLLANVSQAEVEAVGFGATR